jgi:hypothetical protein
MRTLLAALLLLTCAAAFAQARPPVTASAGNLIRNTDGRVDIDATIAALRRMGVTTFLYPVWEQPRDFDDLDAFAAAADRVGIDIWVYTVAYSGTAPLKPKAPDQLPYKTDYVAWGRAIGELSLRRRNVNAWVMDDFYENAGPGRFTRPYVQEMLDAARKQNPLLRFFPVVYFQQPWADFIDHFGDVIDGAVVCYPRSEEEVENSLLYLHDQGHGPSFMISVGQKEKIPRGAEAVATAVVPRGGADRLRFYFSDIVTPGGTKDIQQVDPETHRAYVRVNGRTVWEKEIDPLKMAGGIDGLVDLELPANARSPDTTIELGIRFDRHDDGGASIRARFDDIRLVGKPRGARRGERVRELDALWRVGGSGRLKPEMDPASQGGGRYTLPMYLLVAAIPSQHEKRYNEPPTLDNVRKKIQFAFDCVGRGQAAGVVAWWTPLTGPDANIGDAFRDVATKSR